ncbi:methyltransferase family protein [Herbaspirillum sp. GCM10030257]|uniref:methyltransferase family protein n=1 Tax=Herbaspirillum sp. GCM10030257 TaxID=3273393 RepID=UPI0036193494
MRTMLRITLATVAFAAVHSALATRTAKQATGKLIGNHRRDAGYRLVFVGQSVLGFAWLVTYAASLPKKTVYRITGPAALLMRLGQAAGALHLLSGLHAIGFTRWAGLRNFSAYREGRPIPAGPVAQGPEIMDNGCLAAGGPFQSSRHPLNFSGIPLFWLTPHMTTRRLGFNIVSTVYFVLGSAHEEARLVDAYGDVYRAYRNKGMPFFWPSLPFVKTPKDAVLPRQSR